MTNQIRATLYQLTITPSITKATTQLNCAKYLINNIQDLYQWSMATIELKKAIKKAKVQFPSYQGNPKVIKENRTPSVEQCMVNIFNPKIAQYV